MACYWCRKEVGDEVEMTSDSSLAVCAARTKQYDLGEDLFQREELDRNGEKCVLTKSHRLLSRKKIQKAEPVPPAGIKEFPCRRGSEAKSWLPIG